MKSKSQIVAIAVCCLLPMTANGQPSPSGAFFSLGVGGASCGEFASAKEYNDRLRLPNDPPGSYRDSVYIALLSWVEGFVTGVNYVGPADRLTGSKADGPARIYWLENYCRAHPLDVMLNAALALRSALLAEGK